MWRRKAATPDPLPVLGAIAIQILHAVYGLGVALWALHQGVEYGYFGAWTVIISSLAVLDLGLLVTVTYRITNVIRAGTKWNRMGTFLLLEIILSLTTTYVVLGPFLDILGWD